MQMIPVRSRLLPSAIVALLALPAASGAQGRAATARDTVPVAMYPPAGKCRIWMFGVPAAQQPATTDCGTALRQKPANSLVLYGPTQRDAESERFDTKVGEDPRGTKAGSERTNGSAAEQEIERRREDAARARQRQEMQEREARRRAAAERAAILGARTERGGSSTTTPSNGGTTAVPRGSTANSTGSSGSTGSASPPPSPPKPPAEAKKKPE